jgi:hypothetical protein
MSASKGDGSNLRHASQMPRWNFCDPALREAKVALFYKWLKYGQFQKPLHIFTLDFRSARL